MHTQWIESTLLPRLETQLRPAPLEEAGMQRFGVEIDGRRVVVGLPAALLRGLAAPDATPDAAPTGDPSDLCVPAPGTLVRWLVDDGAPVAEGEAVAVLDAMKMETQVVAHRAGAIDRSIEVGATLAAGAVIARIH